MILFIPDALKLLLAHDRQIVKYYPYRDDSVSFFECWLIVEDYNEQNRPENAAANIKLFSVDEAVEVVGILDQPNKLIFSDNEVFFFSGVNVIPLENNQISVSTSSTTAKLESAKIQNVREYNDFEFNLLRLGEYVDPRIRIVSAKEGRGFELLTKLIIFTAKEDIIFTAKEDIIFTAKEDIIFTAKEARIFTAKENIMMFNIVSGASLGMAELPIPGHRNQAGNYSVGMEII